MSFSRICALTATWLLALPLHAKPAVIVTLASVGDRVRAQNPELAAARFRIREALGRSNQAGRLDNPELETGIEHDSRFREGRVELGISQRFPITDRLRLEKEVSVTELKSAEAEVRDVERQFVAGACELVVKIQASRQRRELLQEQAGLSNEFARFLSKAVERGEGSVIDAGQAKLDAAGLAMELRQVEAAETSLVGELKPLLGMRPGDGLTVSGTLSTPQLPPAAADPSGRPDFQKALLDAQAAAQNVVLEQARRYEDVEGGVFAGAERREDAPEGLENEAIVGVRFKIPLPLWNRNEGNIEAADAVARRREQEADALKRNILLEEEAARAEMREWVKLAREIESTLLPQAAEQADLAEQAWHSGQSDLLTVLRAREQRLKLAAARLDALMNFHLARVRHQAAVGKL